MLTQNEIVDRLRSLPGEFYKAKAQGKWARARLIYDTALKVALFCDVEQNLREELFGVHGYEDRDVKDGRFRDEDVLKVYEKCIITNQTNDDALPMRMPPAKR